VYFREVTPIGVPPQWASDALLRDEPAEGESEKVDLVEAQCADERDGICCHRFNRAWCRAFGRAYAAIVEGDHAVLRRDAVDHSGIPVVQVRGQMIQEDHRYAGIGTQLAIPEPRLPTRTDFVGASLCKALLARVRIFLLI
jgi:hypothetical protein